MPRAAHSNEQGHIRDAERGCREPSHTAGSGGEMMRPCRAQDDSLPVPPVAKAGIQILKRGIGQQVRIIERLPKEHLLPRGHGKAPLDVTHVAL